MRIFDNPTNLPGEIACARLYALAEGSQCSAYDVDVLDENEDPVGVHHYVAVQSSLEDAEIEAALSEAATAAEVADLSATRAARGGFMALPNWATWSANEAEAYVHSNILAGQTQTEVNTYIDATVTSVAGARTAFKQIAASLIAVRVILEALAQAVVFIRQLVVRFGR
jgi:hypothetical protein